MSWYRNGDGKIITDEEFQDDCCDCTAFCSEGIITVPCNGERTDCPYYKEVDTSEYDAEIRNKSIDDVFEFLKTQRNEKNMKVNFDDLEIRKYKEQMKGVQHG